MESVHYSCQTVMELEFSRQSFENQKIKFYENPASGIRADQRRQKGGQTLRNDEAKSHFSQHHSPVACVITQQYPFHLVTLSLLQRNTWLAFQILLKCFT
jgi:hypothetical protein